MGDELIPVASEAQAKEFLKDHKGKGILKFRRSPRTTSALL